MNPRVFLACIIAGIDMADDCVFSIILEPI